MKTAAQNIIDGLEWVDGPPERERGTAANQYDWSFLMGLLAQRPGEWARLNSPHGNPSRVAHYLQENFPCEAVQRNGLLYARWTGNGAA